MFDVYALHRWALGPCMGPFSVRQPTSGTCGIISIYVTCRGEQSRPQGNISETGLQSNAVSFDSAVGIEIELLLLRLI